MMFDENPGEDKKKFKPIAQCETIHMYGKLC